MYRVCWIFLLALLFPKTSWAYLDPSTIQIFLASVVGFISAMLIYAKSIIQKIKKFFTNLRKKK